MIVKLQQGSQGIGTMIAETPQAVTSLLETFWAMGQDIVIQEYLKEAKGRDIRVIVVGNKVIGAMQRKARAGEFRSNLHRGGVAVGVKITPELKKTALQAARIMGLHVAGVDIVPTRKGPRVLEVNSSPGLEGIEKATGIDVAGAMIDYAEKFAEKHRKLGAKKVVASITEPQGATFQPRRRA